MKTGNNKIERFNRSQIEWKPYLTPYEYILIDQLLFESNLTYVNNGKGFIFHVNQLSRETGISSGKISQLLNNYPFCIKNGTFKDTEISFDYDKFILWIENKITTFKKPERKKRVNSGRKHRSQDEQYRSQDEQYRSQDEQYRSQDEQYRSQDEQYRSQDEQYRSQDETISIKEVKIEVLKEVEKEVGKISTSEPVNNDADAITLKAKRYEQDLKNLEKYKANLSPESYNSQLKALADFYNN